ncbi:MAG: type II and III secretion system protein family protein [Blastocatellales bacterium]
MNTQLHRIHPVLRGVIASVAMVAVSLCAVAQERATLRASFADNAQPVKIDVQVGQSRVIDFDQEVDRVASSDPKVVETVPISFRQVLINGLQFGQVNLVAWSKPKIKGEASRMLVFDIYVQVNLSLIDNQIKILFPKENIQLSQANNSVVLSGSVTRPELSEQAQKIIEAAGLKVTNLLKSPILDAAQVQLQIRVAEVDRQILREISPSYGLLFDKTGYDKSFGFSPGGLSSILSGVGGGTVGVILGTNRPNQYNGFIQALYTRGAIRELAEPNLIAMHGQKATFLAGGEFPIPVIQSVATTGQNTITVLFKEFGVKLGFVPHILDENHIRLELEPEVSTLDFAAGIRLQDLIIPGLRVRRAKTTLELRDGQSFALAGLLNNTEQVNVAKIPLLGDIPILGEVFKSRRFQRNETELMFLATVKLVEPLNPDQIPRLPGVSELKPVGAVSPAGAVPSSSIEGQSGHSIPRKAGEQTPESETRTKSEQPITDKSATDKVDKGATENLTSKLIVPAGPTVPSGPSGSDARAPKTENAQSPKPVAPKPDEKDQKPPQGDDKP